MKKRISWIGRIAVAARSYGRRIGFASAKRAWLEPPEARQEPRSCGRPMGFIPPERAQFEPPKARQEPRPTNVPGIQ